MDTFDVVIVGARCAGSPLAILLARLGLRVCLLDRSRFPSETPSTHVIQPHGVQILDELGVLDAVLSAGAVSLDRFTLVNDDVRIDATLDSADFTKPGLCVRRSTLDVLMVEAAARAGADVRTGCRVTGVRRDGSGRLSGVDTESGTLRARLTVGADGRHSTIAASVGADEYLVTPPGRMPMWAYFSGAGDTEARLRIGRIGELAYLASPTDGGLYMAAIGVDMPSAGVFHADRDASFTEAIARWPELADLLAGARRVGPIRVMTNWHGYFRSSAGPGWALVGDAGHFKDFSAAQGISDALRQAKRLAASLTGDSAGWDAALQRWWRWRDRDAYSMYWLANDMGVPGASPPLITSIMRQIALDERATRTLLRVLNHELPPSKLFTVRRLAQAAVHTLIAQPRQVPRTAADMYGATARELRRAVARRRLASRRLRPCSRTFSRSGSSTVSSAAATEISRTTLPIGVRSGRGVAHPGESDCPAATAGSPCGAIGDRRSARHRAPGR